jgi:hypothetical protein
MWSSNPLGLSRDAALETAEQVTRRADTAADALRSIRASTGVLA